VYLTKVYILFFLTRKESKENRPHTRTLAVRFCPSASDLALGVL
jgi:hypothetical protein